MQKKIKRQNLNASKSPKQDAPEKVEILRTSAVSNDNAKPAEVSATPKLLTVPPLAEAPKIPAIRPKVFRSPNKPDLAVAFGKKPASTPIVVSPLADTSKDEIPMSISGGLNHLPLISKSSEKEVSANDSAQAQPETNKKSGVYFDLKFASALIAIVVAVNFLLAMLVDTKEQVKSPMVAQTTVRESAEQKAVATTQVVPSVSAHEQGAIVSGNLPEIQPSAGAVKLSDPVAAPTTAPAKPELGVITTAKDEKRMQRSLYSIINQY